ncbi:YveK family protein [Gorillibacterium sp. sgz5001074]|uniref:YveK family protein n=1 Tax=Gorillibacterium sp. sgz5001074 TaxID=3446695 RepID=UPI003F675288
MELKQYWRILRKRLWLIAACVIVATATTGVYSFFFIEKVYQASTKLIVNQSKENMANQGLDLNSVNLNLKLIDTYKEIIKTPAIMDKVVEQYPDLNMTAGALGGAIKVSSVNGTQVMTLSVQHTSYNKAVQIVNAVSLVFKQEIPNIMKVDNVSILNEARPSDHPVPVKPNPVLNVLVGLVVSLMAAVGLVFLLDYLDDSIKTEQDIQDILGLTTLTVVARMTKEDVTPKSSETSERKLGETTYGVAVNK